MSDPDFLKFLNPPQREAVTHGDGPLLIIAGAGSGKTRVLTYRIAWLVGHLGVPPARILAVTFTNKAAGEMRDRVRGLLGAAANDVWVGTFHSTCARILRKEIHHLGYSTGFVIYDEKDSQGLIREALRRCDLDEKIYAPGAMLWQIEQAKHEALSPEQAAARADGLQSSRVAKVYEVYQELLRESNALDFGDLIRLTVELFERHPRVAEYYAQRWRHVLVDEYQDTNHAQYRLVRLLARASGNLCCVGDEDQNVYSWRGATIRNILDFEHDFPGARVVKLEQNYRSTNLILKAAGSVVARNRRRRAKSLWTDRAGGEPIVLYEGRDEYDEARFIVGEIRRLALERYRHGGMAIFYRTNAQSRVIEEELLAANIGYTVVGGVKFYDRAEVKDLLAYLRVIHNPADAMGLRRIINTPPRGIGKTTIDRAEERARKANAPLEAAMRALVDDPEAPAAARRKIAEFFQLIDRLREGARGALPSALLQKVIERTGYTRRLEAEDTPESRSRVENIEELVTSVFTFEENTPDASLAGYLDQITLVSDVDQLEEAPERVVLMTVHSAKGLEFPIVFMAGMEEGLFPHGMSADDPERLEEERRLCYVGMTRAKDRLYLLRAVARRVFGSLRFNEPSRFFAEVPPELIAAVRARERGWEPGPARTAPRGAGRPEASRAKGARADFNARSGTKRAIDYSYDQSGEYGEDGERALSPLADLHLTRGMQVRHPNLGLGTIERLEGEGRQARIVVRFQRAGLRTFMLAYAELEIV
jgi:DNA helicase-2/ATP-dependent DNA helicase PcrA